VELNGLLAKSIVFLFWGKCAAKPHISPKIKTKYLARESLKETIEITLTNHKSGFFFRRVVDIKK